jgi:hypothetical protein
MNSTYKTVFVLGVLSLFLLPAAYAKSPPAGPAAVNLGTAGNFVILSQAGISTTGTTSIKGDIGVSPIAATGITGFSLVLSQSGTFATSSLVTGKVYAADYAAPTPATLTTAVSDMQTAYTNAQGRTPGVGAFLNVGAGTLSGLTLAPGVYTWTSNVAITGSITLSGSSKAVWIFQIPAPYTLTVSNGITVTLSGGATPDNVFWAVGGATTIGTTVQFQGIILAATNIAMQTGATLTGRALAQTAVTLDSNAVTAPGANHQHK